MPNPWELTQQILTPRAKVRMQKPQRGGRFLVQISGCTGGWLWMKFIPALNLCTKKSSLEACLVP